MKRGRGDKKHPYCPHRIPLFPFPVLSLWFGRLTILSFVEGPKGLFPLFLLLGLLLTNPSCSGQTQPLNETRFMMGTLVDVMLYADKDGNPLNRGDAVKFAIEVGGKRRTGSGRVAELASGLVKIRTTKNFKRPQGKGNKSDLEVTFPVSKEGVAFVPSTKKGRDLFVALGN